MKTRASVIFALVLIFLLIVLVPATNARPMTFGTPQPALLVGGQVWEDGPGHVYAYTADGLSLGQWEKGGPPLYEPQAVRYGPMRTVVYVLDEGDQVQVYSARTGQWLKTLIPESAGLYEAFDMIFMPSISRYGGVLLMSVNSHGGYGEGGRVMAFDAGTGRYLRDVVLNGAGDGVDNRLSEAMGLAMGPNGTLYVGNDAWDVNDQVMKFRLSGPGATYRGLAVDGENDYIQDPNNMTFGPDGKLYISWEDDNLSGVGAVMRYDPATSSLDDFVSPSLGESIGLYEAQGLAFGRGGDLYVGSGDTAEVYVFNSAGVNVNSFLTLAEPKALLWIGPTTGSTTGFGPVPTS